MHSLRMNKGQGSTSYARNSRLQRQIIIRSKPIMEKAMADCLKNTLSESIGTADLGCSSGPNALMSMYNIVNALHSTCSQMGINMPDMRMALNDLPHNDFNDIFMLLPEFYDNIRQDMGIEREGCFVSAVPGSFYGRLFPAKSLHFVHSSTSLQWLSKVPDGLDAKASEHLNKGKIHLSNTSPKCVFQAYFTQFKTDLSAFLRSRSEEVVSRGGMVLVIHGRNSRNTTSNSAHPWLDLVEQALMNMASEGLFEEEKIDALNLPYYAPLLQEVRNIIQGEGSFSIAQQDSFDVDSKELLSAVDKLSIGQQTSNAIRSVFESLLEAHFETKIMDELFARLVLLADECFPEGQFHMLVFYVIRN